MGSRTGANSGFDYDGQQGGANHAKEQDLLVFGERFFGLCGHESLSVTKRGWKGFGWWKAQLVYAAHNTNGLLHTDRQRLY